VESGLDASAATGGTYAHDQHRQADEGDQQTYVLPVYMAAQDDQVGEFFVHRKLLFEMESG
jgi:hypothetical protein